MSEVDCGFNPAETTVKRSRYTLEGERCESPSGGIVTRGRASGKDDAVTLLIHTNIPSRNEQAIDLGAVATAVLHGAVPLDSIMLAFKRAGKLEEIEAALVKVKPVEKKVASAK